MNDHPPKLRGVESIRGALALTVFLCHVWIIFIGSGSNSGVGPLHSALNVVSRFAVVAFFVVSGFVIALTIDRNRLRGFRATDYWIARLVRIVPPLLAVIAITWLLYVALLYSGMYFVSWGNAERGTFHTDPMTQLLSILSLTLFGDLQGGGFNGPLWSLMFEVRLYVIAGLVAVIAFGRWKLAAVLALVVFAWASHVQMPEAAKGRQIAMALCFALGAAGYALRNRRLLLPAAIFVMTFCALSVFLPWRNAHAFLDAPGWLLAQWLFAGAFAILLVAVSHTHALDRRYGLGAFSYTLYALHFPLLLAVYFVAFNIRKDLMFGASAYVIAAIATPVVLGLCIAVARAVERPAQHRAWLMGNDRGKAGLGAIAGGACAAAPGVGVPRT